MKKIIAISLWVIALPFYSNAHEQEDHVNSQVQDIRCIKNESYRLDGTTTIMGIGICLTLYRIYKLNARVNNLEDSLEQNARDIKVHKDIIANHSKKLLGPDYKEYNGGLTLEVPVSRT